MDSGIKAFLKAICARWFTAMSGAFSVPASIAAVLATSETAKLVYGITALVCIFIAAYWPWRIEREIAASLKAKLDEIGFQRLLDFKNSAFKVYENGTTMDVAILLENTGSQMLRCELDELLFEINGAKAQYQPQDKEIFIASQKEMAHTFTIQGLHLNPGLPATIIIGFAAKYDNIPPVKERVCARIIKYEYQSLSPANLTRQTVLSAREE